jgi:hypothetical protein
MQIEDMKISTTSGDTMNTDSDYVPARRNDKSVQECKNVSTLDFFFCWMNTVALYWPSLLLWLTV